jgi:hypothetical protein
LYSSSMNKHFVLFLALLLGLSSFSHTQGRLSLVSEIFLVDDEMYRKYVPPGEVILGVEMEAEALYKISAQNEILRGGLLRRGFNSLRLSTRGFFEKSDSHVFVLEMKSDDSLEKREITIDVRLLPVYMVQKRGEERKKYEYSVSFFIGGRLIYSTKKIPLSDITFKLDLPPSQGVYNPFGQIDGMYKPPQSFSILDAIAGIYSLVNALDSGKDKENRDQTIQRKQQIETTFVKSDTRGNVWQWRALIQLETKTLN